MADIIASLLPFGGSSSTPSQPAPPIKSYINHYTWVQYVMAIFIIIFISWVLFLVIHNTISNDKTQNDRYIFINESLFGQFGLVPIAVCLLTIALLLPMVLDLFPRLIRMITYLNVVFNAVTPK